MGHSDLSVLRHWLAQTEDDLTDAHRRVGPADNLLCTVGMSMQTPQRGQEGWTRAHSRERMGLRTCAYLPSSNPILRLLEKRPFLCYND